MTDGTWAYTWTQGRKLQQIAKSGTTISYKYNDSGIRTEKTVNGVTTVYNVVGGQVTWEKTGSNTPIYYTYDASGSLWGIQYNGSMYFYARNAQGDIVKLINSSGTVVVEYAYDAWGKLLSTTGSLASTLGLDNPYRYRGYRYDTETGLYYLQSRYYNPHWGRFVNADGLIGTANGVGNHNIFSFCHNNAIMFSDNSGFIPSFNVMLSDGSGINGFFRLITPINCRKFYHPYISDRYVTYNTVDEAAAAWARIYRNKSYAFEFGAMICSQVEGKSKKYFLSNTYTGTCNFTIPILYGYRQVATSSVRAGAVFPLLFNYIIDARLVCAQNYDTRIEAFVHSHPHCAVGSNSFASKEDLWVTTWPLIESIYVIPYDNDMILSYN